MKKIVILTSIEGWGQIGFELEDGFEKFNKEINDIHVIVMSDNCDIEDLKNECGLETPPDFLAYHNTAMNNKITKIDLNDSYLEKCMCKAFSHYNIEDEFYKKLLPKVYIHRDLKLGDIENYFQSQLELALNLFHNIYFGKTKKVFKTNEVDELIKESKCSNEFEEFLEGSHDSWTYTNKKQETLSNFKEKLLAYATKNELL